MRKGVSAKPVCQKKKEEKTKESGLRKDQRSTHTYTNIHTHKKKKDQVVEKKKTGPNGTLNGTFLLYINTCIQYRIIMTRVRKVLDSCQQKKKTVSRASKW